MEEITAAGRIPLLVGGLCYILKRYLKVYRPPSANSDVRAEIEKKSSRARVGAIQKVSIR